MNDLDRRAPEAEQALTRYRMLFDSIDEGSSRRSIRPSSVDLAALERLLAHPPKERGHVS